MEIEGRHVFLTGAAGGIGRALARRLAAEGATLALADRDRDGVEALAAELGATGLQLDAGREDSIVAALESAKGAAGPVDILISNAGVPGGAGGPEAPDAGWDEAWRVNVMAHVWASRALLPEMIARKEGYLINTASAAGLLTQVSSLVYSVTKHAAVSLAEWMSIEYVPLGVRVSCICPQGVRTPMLELAMEDPVGAAALEAGGALLEPEQVAETVVAGINAERLLILPHEEVAGYLALKGADPERWLKGMRRLVGQVRGA